jgi:Pectate lyase superfamily protein
VAALVGPLVSGISGAPNGRVEFYSRGTANLSTKVYTDPNGQTPTTTHTLDSNGSIVRYITEPVDVVVKTSQGATARQWTEIGDARTIRVENSLFKGPNPSGNGQTIAGGMTTLHDDLTRFRESLGSTDARVNVNGVDYLISAALGSSTGTFYNVKTGYGAQGDNTNDDTSAIQSAINAAVASGGIVFFPPGTYKTTGSLVLSGTDVTLLGSGRGSSIISIATAGVPALDVNSSNNRVTSLQFKTSTGSLAADLVDLKGVSSNTFESCSFTVGAGLGFDVNSSSTMNTFVSCQFSMGSSTAGRFAGDSGSASNSMTSFTNCRFSNSLQSASTMIGAFRGSFFGCQINCTSVTGGTTLFAGGVWYLSSCILTCANTSGTHVFFASSTKLHMVGCEVLIGSGGTYNLFASGSVNTSLHEAACTYPAGLANCAPDDSSHTVDMRMTPQSVSGTSYTPSLDFGVHEITHTGASIAFGNPTGTPNIAAGTMLKLFYFNNSGGARTPTWGTAYSGVPATAVNNGNTALYLFVYCTNVISGEWVAVTTNPVVAAA